VGNLVFNLHVSGDQLFIYKRSVAAQMPDGGFVFRMPKQGGEPELLGPMDLDPGFADGAVRAGIMAVVGDELIVDEGFSSGVSALSLSDGSRRRLLNDTQADQATSMHFAEGRLWYGSENGLGDLFYRDVAGADAMPVALYEGGCSGGSILQNSRIWFRASASGIYCGGNVDIPRLALDGSGRSSAWEVPAARRFGTMRPLRVEGQTLYLGSDEQGVQLSLDTGEARSFSCSAVGVDALVTTLDRIVWGGSDSDGLLNGLQIGPAEHEGIFVVPK
jgi:hypothetical protein